MRFMISRARLTGIRLAGRLTAADVARLDPLIRDRLMTMLRLPRWR